MHAVINGAGVAGPTLAWWLNRDGHDVTLVDHAPSFRTGGYIIDFWGVGYEVACRMGLEQAIRSRGYQVERVRYVDERGRTSATLSVSTLARQLAGRFTSLPRGDLAEAIFDDVKDRIDTRFGDTIAAVEQDDARVACRLASGSSIDADLLIGADGLHSKIRELVFGPEATFERDLGYRVAAFQAKGYRPRDEDVYIIHAEPGCSISRFAMADDTTLFLLVFTADEASGSRPQSDDAVRRTLHAVYGDVGWEAPAVLEAMQNADDVYFDTVSQIRMPTWSRGRVGLIGDAAACVSLLAGEGTGLAMTEAYVLAGELHEAGGDVPRALRAYERRLKAFLEGKQTSATRTASSFAPKTALGLWIRDRVLNLMRLPFVAELVLGAAVKDDFELPDYR